MSSAMTKPQVAVIVGSNRSESIDRKLARALVALGANSFDAPGLTGQAGTTLSGRCYPGGSVFSRPRSLMSLSVRRSFVERGPSNLKGELHETHGVCCWRRPRLPPLVLPAWRCPRR
jgi:hypothetical protein